MLRPPSPGDLGPNLLLQTEGCSYNVKSHHLPACITSNDTQIPAVHTNLSAMDKLIYGALPFCYLSLSFSRTHTHTYINACYAVGEPSGELQCSVPLQNVPTWLMTGWRAWTDPDTQTNPVQTYTHMRTHTDTCSPFTQAQTHASTYNMDDYTE